MVGFEARTPQGAALRPTSHFVYESIYTAILEKRLAPAAKLSKETLGQIFRVSNGTIQRALTRLAEDGAVVMAPKEVASVARPDERQARQVLEARLLVESEVLRQLRKGVDATTLDELRALVDEEQACLEARDSAGVIRLAGRFHLRLAECTENPLLLGFVRGLVARASLDIALNKGAVYSAEACVAQRGLLDALEAGDSVAATELMDEYLRGLFARMRFLPPPTTDLRKAFGMSARRQDKRQEA
ncbi:MULTISPECIES: GntR family transcriptional regulator [Pseudomonas aeruginosa group]|uniref:GntR family transcriptional regulator n=1 Tax=Pseudomonas aeruginosa group TaxID=136841 RepID=UPI00071B6AE3|nr:MULTISPECIES: GntR family transcriptional regulator [Pseudomonas aeruginosa group]KSP88649.1 transcriptional regulator [Pseudomonas aeruginosa]MBG3905790.1 GntR family transcriptional regulator [Pseudomonas aeruginosa]MBG4200548.1 GntR family transcriptional regulator [Pseudomonas aeruginosa]MBG4281848.1 GntR family transcriptional regulator [Pseudomonas aeruginosa]MBG5755137.1 GntR family transcriptional regulator [Pseudomonas aeruginosa]